MSAKQYNCPICQSLLIEVEVALNRTWANAFFTGFGSSELQIRTKNGKWMAYMEPGRAAKGLYCTDCGALTSAPTIKAHRKELGLEP